MGCGKPVFTDRIVGGTNALQGKWPWQVSIFYSNRHICGGSLVSDKWVVSAAHCFDDLNVLNYIVFLGCQNLTKLDTAPAVSRNLTTILIYPMYQGEGGSGDLALLELKSPVTLNNYILPICVPPSDLYFPSGKMCWVTGWGDTQTDVQLTPPYTLQEVEVPLINASTCNNMYSITFGFDPSIKLIEDDMVCAGYPEGQKDSCQGDSGGPLACKSDKYWYLTGIVSWGEECAGANKPGVYTNVSVFYSWIQEKIKVLTSTTSPTSSSNMQTMLHEDLNYTANGTMSMSVEPTRAFYNVTLNDHSEYESLTGTGEYHQAFVILSLFFTLLNVFINVSIL
ncbi:serine protease 27-like [Bombina bombina]|uniref:serine protease 27-like n=1 Tax=Bombina bombina TaxID=8345 RepID=UPI00235A5E51|nr:serine protease 27-like [Bombina bombina]